MSAIQGIMHSGSIAQSLVCNTFMEALNQFPFESINTFYQDNIFLSCHNQWITTESIGEKLPYYDYQRQLAIISDAIIDNREELFQQLQICKSEQKTIPDSKLILLAYYKWGKQAPKYFQGDFAFMIWDEKNKHLFGARDFSGARTLYYHHNQSYFAFSTIIESLLRLPYVEKKLNEEWLAEYLAIPTMVEAVDMQSTVYRNIYQVPPSHSITIKDGKVSLSRYCTIEIKKPLKLNSNEEYEEAFREVFQRAVQTRLRTHGEVGSHLSGGLDSGSVVSFASRELKKENKLLHTYSYIPEEDFVDFTPNYYLANEKPYIKETVNFAGNISDNYLDFKGKSPVNEIDSFMDMMEMPYKFFENAFWLKGIFEEANKKGIKILLNGARGNHTISWGSMTLTFNYYAELMKKIRLIKLIHELDRYCYNFYTGKSVMLPFVAKRAFSGLFHKKEQTENSFPTFINPMFAQKTKVFEKLEAYGLSSITNPSDMTEYRKEYFKKLFVWNKSGVAGTKLSLRYGVWERDPTNDINVIRFCLALPEEQFVTDGLARSIIRRSTKGILPEKVRLNHHIRGIQGADVIHRMKPEWNNFMKELEELSNHSWMKEFIKEKTIKDAITFIGKNPKDEILFTNEFKILTRSLIVYRFLKRL
ncbi:asparagine synthetase B family protein [Oceanobacillus piezotolerans]|uniref:asparagine synthase (glutamine-hydrolyzing) n=1 Tax=Oceanobacillus piezotolerans TaxID=2448030 RepID=A0A498D8B7_9BACI|nr:asparagine synthase-related protein [Oceanobacillus piezotolerans]RLL42773.1 asparagine synthetase B family protein [Oceanobacillus piezotolerans]